MPKGEWPNLEGGAGDENRTRTISLGSAAVTAARDADLVFLAAVSDPGCPLVTLVNGPLMARRRGHIERRPSVFRPDISPVAAKRASVLGYWRPLALAVGRDCCCQPRLTLRSSALLPSADYTRRSPACRSRPRREGATGTVTATRQWRARAILSCCFGCVLVAVTGRRKLPTRAD